MSSKTSQNALPKVVKEENSLLNHVLKHLSRASMTSTGNADYDKELILLRDAIAEASPEDVPPLVEQMTRIQSLAAQRGLGQDIPVDRKTPYFGHLRLEEAEQDRDVLLGKHTYLSPAGDVRIVDWRNAPVSRMYYSYEEGDEYEETFGGKVRRGQVTVRRSITILDAELERVACPDRIFAKRDGEWIALEPNTSRLFGGQGTAIRAEGLSPVRGVLGVDADGVDRKDKHLPEIAALLDSRQFDLISSASSGLIILKGGAGSGKTTVGLHRIAYLAFENPRKFNPRRMIVVVLTQALAAYISRVLPALGVHGVEVTTFANWSTAQRRRHIRGLPTRHSLDTPQVVSRLKKHPAILRILDDLVDQEDEQLTARLFDAVAGTPEEAKIRSVWQGVSRYPIDVRRHLLLRWLKGDTGIRAISDSVPHPRTARAAESALLRMERQTSDVIANWADLFTDREALGAVFEVNAPSEFTSNELDEVHEWCVSIYAGLEADDDDPPVIDAEDEAILLRLHQLKRGWLRDRGRRLSYDHLMVDEAQDFSPVELSVLMGTVQYKQPVTLAGDTAQRIVPDSGFVSWEELLADLGIQGRRVAPLEVAYRSTIPIMNFSKDVLGPYLEDRPQAKRQGAPVELHRFTEPGQAVGFLGECLRDLVAREPLSNVAVIARYTDQARLYYEGLQKSEIPRLSLVVDEDFSFSPGIEVTEVRQVKGLEFDYVILVEVTAESYPDTEESRHMLHIGATRAAHQLWLVATGTPSPILPEWLL